jgi:L-ribulose-5-phosphate 4-epimerase
MRNHGPFTIGPSPKDAVRVAVVLEDVARSVHIAQGAGPIAPIPEAEIDRLYQRSRVDRPQTTGARGRTPSRPGRRSEPVSDRIADN